MTISDLSPDEIRLIEEHRRKKREQEEYHRQTQKILKVAAGFESWMYKHDIGPSYSTFTNEFGYQGADSHEVYNIVDNLRHVAAYRIIRTQI